MTSSGTEVRRRLRRLPIATVAALALAVGLAACGSDSDSDSGTATAASAGADTAGLKAAQTAETEAMKAPTTLGLPKWEKPFPEGKTVTYVHCGVEVCNTIVDAIKNAAGVAGWNVKVVPSDGSPASVKAAWETVVRLKPDAAFGSGFYSTLFASAVAKLKSMDIPVLLLATQDKVGNGIELVKLGSEEVTICGEQMAAWTVSSTEGKANTLYVDLPDFAILNPVMTSFEAKYKEWCPSCELEKMSVPLTSLGSKAPGMIVGYLRSHPEVNRVALGYDGIGVGLPAALKAAGLADKVQVVGEAPTATNLSYIEDGGQAATVGQGYYEIWANMVDAAARYMTDQPLDANAAFKPPYWLVTKDNVTEANPPKPLVPDLNGELAGTWGVS